MQSAQKGIPEGKVFELNKQRLAAVGSTALQEMLDKRDWGGLPVYSAFAMRLAGRSRSDSGIKVEDDILAYLGVGKREEIEREEDVEEEENNSVEVNVKGEDGREQMEIQIEEEEENSWLYDVEEEVVLQEEYGGTLYEIVLHEEDQFQIEDVVYEEEAGVEVEKKVVYQSDNSEDGELFQNLDFFETAGQEVEVEVEVVYEVEVEGEEEEEEEISFQVEGEEVFYDVEGEEEVVYEVEVEVEEEVVYEVEGEEEVVYEVEGEEEVVYEVEVEVEDEVEYEVEREEEVEGEEGELDFAALLANVDKWLIDSPDSR